MIPGSLVATGGEPPEASAWNRAATRTALALGGVAVLALGVYALGWHRVGDTAAESDFFTGYAIGARQLLRGHLDFSRFGVFGPVYEVLLAAVGFLTGDLFTAARLLSVAATGATLFAWWAIARRAFGPGAGLAIVALLVVNPTFARYGYSAATDAPACALFSLAAWALLVPGGRWRRPVAGALAGLATLTRYNLVMLLPAGVLLLLLDRARRPRERFVASAWFLGGALLVLLPWTAASLAAGHVPGITLLRDPGFYEASDPSRVLEERYRDLDAGTRIAPSTGAASSRGSLPLRAARGLGTHLRLDAMELLGLPAALLTALGLLVALRRKRFRDLAPALLLAALTLLPLLPVFYSLRYALVLLPPYLVPASAGLALLSGTAGRRGRIVAVALALAVLVPTGWWAYRSHAEWQSELPLEARAAGEAVRARVRPGERMVARKGHAAYFAGLEPVPFPLVDSLSTLARFCREHRVSYLYYSAVEARSRPDFIYLLDTSAAVPGLTVLHASARPPAVVYRIDPGFGAEPAWWSDTPTLARVSAQVHVLLDPGPDSREYRLRLAEDALARGRPAQALTEARAAVQPGPAGAPARRLEAEALRRLGRRSDAIDTLRAVLRDAPDDVAARIGLGLLLHEAGRDTEATEAWRPVVEAAHDARLLDAMEQAFAATGEEAAVRRVRAQRGRER